MFKNIGKRIRLLAVILAIVTFVSFLALAVVFLVATLRAEDATTRMAGIEGTILFAVLAFFLPLFSWILYGFGTLVESGEKQAADTKEMRDMLKKALADGALSDEIARKTGMVLAKITAAPAPRAGMAQTRPVVRPTITPQAPPVMQPAAPVAPFAAPAAPVTAPAAPAAPVAPVPEPTFAEPAFATPAPATTPAPAATPAPATEESAEPLFTAAPAPQSAPKAAGTPFIPPAPTEPVTPGVAFVPDDPTGAVKPIRPLNSETTY